MILLSELSRRRIRSIQKLIRVGRNEVVVVLRVDREKGTSEMHSRMFNSAVLPESIVRLYRSLETPRLTGRHHQMRRTVHEIQSGRLHHATRCVKSPFWRRRGGRGWIERGSAVGEAVRAGRLAAREDIWASV